ncbi:hypothetical protein N9901_03465, partial [Flavobacteriaceae bacterium]|nr:hypothetical protein [Flavobacteriaceae bacterium]
MESLKFRVLIDKDFREQKLLLYRVSRTLPFIIVASIFLNTGIEGSYKFYFSIFFPASIAFGL